MAKKKEELAPHFDYISFLNESVNDVATRLNYDSDPIEAATPMSTGMLVLDLLYGGGIRAGWYTHFGKEQSSKTTGTLVIGASAVKQGVPLIAYFDYEGCFTANTYISCNNGQQIKLKDLFDLSKSKQWKPNTYQNQYATVDTLDDKHGTKSANARLFYRGIHKIQRIELNTGHFLECYNHKFFVFRNNNYLVIKNQCDLQIGDLVLVQKDYFKPEQEVWKPVLGEGSYAYKKYEVSNFGRIRSKGGTYITINYNGKSTLRVMQPRYLTTRALKDGHLSVNLCVGDGKVLQRLVHRLVARAFIGKPTKVYPLVCHYNDDPTDNRVSNLYYGNNYLNSRDRCVHRRVAQGFNIATAKGDKDTTEHDIFLAKRLYEKTNLSRRQVAEIFNISPNAVTDGFKYIDDLYDRIPFNYDDYKDYYELGYVTSISDLGKKQVFDISLNNENDCLPHSIITNGIVSHNSTASSTPYIQSILKTCGVNKSITEVFGQKDENSGKWITPPIIRFHTEAVGERFFDYLASVLRALPDKKKVHGKWWLVYDDTKQNKAKIGEFANSSMAKKYGHGLWVEAENGELQGLFIVDSYPAMNPQSNDEDEQDNSIALQARMFSKQLPRVKGRLMQKMVAVIGTNQLRDAPMAMYGPKENEPGGQALRYNSDARCKFTPRTSGQPLWPKSFDKETGFEVEKSVEYDGGIDNYRYIQLKTVKNKLSAPNRIGWVRIWNCDGSGNARGYDPVFDTLYYLFMTGQLIGRGRKSMKLQLQDTDSVSTNWDELKSWILGSKDKKIEICKKLGYKKPFDLRKFCFTQLKRGIGEKLYVKRSQSGNVEESED